MPSSSCHGRCFHGRTLGRETHFLQTLSSQSVTFVLSFFGIQRIVQKLLLNLGPLIFWFGQNPINLFLLLHRALSRPIIFALPSILKLLKDCLFFLTSDLVGFDFDMSNAVSQLRSTCSRLCVLSCPPIQDVLRGGYPWFDVRLEPSRRDSPWDNVTLLTDTMLHPVMVHAISSSTVLHVKLVVMMMMMSIWIVLDAW